ncbi:MAG: hypothetical protein ACOC95_06600 [Planctomycetota bacterium]
MAGPLHRYLRRVARKLLRVRAVEALAVGATATAASSACFMAAWIIAGPHRLWAALLALLPAAVLVGVVPTAGRLRRLRPLVHLADRWEVAPAIRWFLAAMALPAAVLAVAMVLSGRHVQVPHPWIAVVLVPLGGLMAAATVLARGITLHEAALYVDLRANLGERLTTALELSEDTSETFARAVQEEAMQAIAQHRPHRLGFFRRRRGTLIALAAGLLMTVALGMIDPLDAAERRRRQRQAQTIDRVATALAEQARVVEQKASQTQSRQLTRQAEQLRRLSEDMRWGRAGPRDAMRELSRMQDEMRSARARQDALDAAIDRLRAYDATTALADQAGQAARATDDGGAGEFANRTTRRMADGTLSADQQHQLGAGLRDAADAATDDPRLSAALRQAADMVDRNHAEGFRDAMNQVGQAMSDAQTEAGAAQARAEAMNRLQEQKQQLATAGDGTDGFGRGGITPDDLRQAIARAGSQGGRGQGGGGQGGGGRGGGEGGGQGDGQGGGQGNRQGRGQGQGGDGRSGGQGGRPDGSGGSAGAGGGATGGGGSTNRDTGSGPGGRYEGGAVQEGRWARIYAPEPIESEGPQLRPAGTPDPEGEPAARARFRAPAATGESYVSFEKAWSASQRRAEDALSRQRIPARMRRLIRDYYDSPQ